MAKELWTRRGADLLQARIPLPFPLRWVNSYLVKGREGFTLIDPGLNTGQALAAWQQVMAEADISFQDISAIVLTHHHPDHYGLAGWFQEKAGAAVYLSEIGERQADMLWGESRAMPAEIVRLFLRHGMAEELADAMQEHTESFVPLVSPRPEITVLGGGDRFVLGRRDCLVIENAGHAAGHLSFWDANNRELFCGDQVLPQITPNVSYDPIIDPDPLASYLESLREMANIKAVVAYPGHRDPFAGFADRAEEIIHHHEERLQQIAALANNAATAYELCRSLFGYNLSVHQLRFALSETIAHLYYLSRRGKMSELSDGSRVLFMTAKA